MKRNLRIAMIGQRMVPARYGGVETHVENVAVRLAGRGHEVTVFCRRRYRSAFRAEGKFPPGMRIVYRPSVNTKHLDAATHSFLCALESACRRRFDLVHFHGIGPSAFTLLPRLLGRKVITTIHALDWRQVKWGRKATWALKKGEWMGVRGSHGVIAVSRQIASYLEEAYSARARYIPNGACLRDRVPPRNLDRYGLRGGDYVLTVGRIIPERGLDKLIAAFDILGDRALKLVVVGSEQPRTSYSDELERRAGESVVFTGNLYGEELEELYSNCKLYVLASTAEGLPITVCEAMGYGKGLLLSDIAENREVAGEAAVYFDPTSEEDLAAKLKQLLAADDLLAELGNRGRERVAREYNWDSVARKVEEFYVEILSKEE